MTIEDDVQALQQSFGDLLAQHQQLRAQFEIATNTINPIGTIASFAGSAKAAMEVAGWLLCNGDEVPVSEYPTLARVLGNSWGEAAADKFKLPNLDGLFLRGRDHGSGRDEVREVGSVQMDMLQSHTHHDSGHDHSYYTPERVANDDDQADDEHSKWSTDTSGSYATGAGQARLGEPQESSAGAIRHGAETRPKNATVEFYVRARIVAR